MTVSFSRPLGFSHSVVTIPHSPQGCVAVPSKLWIRQRWRAPPNWGPFAEPRHADISKILQKTTLKIHIELASTSKAQVSYSTAKACCHQRLVRSCGHLAWGQPHRLPGWLSWWEYHISSCWVPIQVPGSDTGLCGESRIIWGWPTALVN